jgi:hypothetical protein
MTAVALAALDRRPIALKAANRFIIEHHRHNEDVTGWLFGSSLWIGDELRSVGIAGRPTGRGFDDGLTVEITRVCTLGDINACSMLYGALCRAAKAIGYRRAITYTLEGELGTSPAAAGFTIDAHLPARPVLANETRPRYVENLFGEKRRPGGAKTRWVRWLARSVREEVAS